MIIGRQRASVDEWRVEGWSVDAVDERGRDGRCMDGGREEASGGGIERGRKGARE